MKAVVLEELGTDAELNVTEVPTPLPLDNEVQIAIKNTGVNPVDWKIREGMLKSSMPHEFPIILGWDAAGTVSAIGKKVSNLKVGDEVIAFCRKPKVKWGTFAEFVCMDAQSVAIKPKNLSFAQAAAIPLAGLTAWQALFDAAKLKKGETVLIHAGAGGVGSLAIQFAKNAGAKVISTAHKKNHSYLKQLGADLAIDYSKENFVDRIKQDYPEGIDVVLDTVGGETCMESLEVLKPKGRLVSILERFDTKNQPKNISCFTVIGQPNGAQLKQIVDLINQKKVLAPNIEEMDLEDASEALDKSRQGHVKGKIVLKVQE